MRFYDDIGRDCDVVFDSDSDDGETTAFYDALDDRQPMTLPHRPITEGGEAQLLMEKDKAPVHESCKRKMVTHSINCSKKM